MYSGMPIPPYIDKLGDISSDALFILLVENDSGFHRLVEDRFYNRFPCIIMRADGQPDVATRLFLRKIKMELKLPVFALTDCDPKGLKKLSAYGCPDVKWLGIRPSDLDKFQIPEHSRLCMRKRDFKTSEHLLEDELVKKNPGWVEELNLMLKTKQKAEMEALCYYGFQYLTKEFLPLKLQQ